jgi:type I restriction enzyme S subunit
MEGIWPMVPLGEILSKSEEWTDIQPDKQYRQVTVRLWGGGVVLRNEVIGNEIAAKRRLVVRSNQFILSRIDARNGAFGLVPESLDGAVVSNDFPAFNINRERIIPGFLEWMSKTRDFVDLCRAASEGTTNRVRLKVDRFLVTPIPLPPLNEQRRIVARIEELAALIEEARELRVKAREEAEALKNSVLRIVFCDWLARATMSTIEEVCDAIIDNLHSTPKYSDDGYPCVRSSDVGLGKLDLTNAKRTPEYEYIRRIQRGAPGPGDIVFVREGGGTGKAALVETEEKFSLGQRVMMFRPDTSRVEPKFFLFQILSPYVYEEQIALRIKGSASPHLNIGAIRQFRFLLPSLAEQRRIVAYLDDLQAQVDQLTATQDAIQAELDTLLPSVLDQAFRGEL